MTDSTLNRFLSSGTGAPSETPVPPTPASGPDPGYLYTDLASGDLYAWDGAAWDLIVDGGVITSAITALTGDVTATGPGSVAATIANNAVTTAKILDANVTLAKMANIATDSLIGRDTAGSGVPQNILLNATLSMDGAGNLQRAALTGDVTAPAGSNATTLANTAATPGSFDVLAGTVDAKGRLTASSEALDDTTTAADKVWSSEKTNAAVTAAGTGGTNQPQLNGLVSGGAVLNVTGTLDFVSNLTTYYIDGILYSAAPDTVTLDAADPTNPRFDVIAVDDSQNLVKITGVAGATPSVPQIDPSTQLALTIVSVAATATDVGAVNEDIFDLVAVWTITTNGATWDTASVAYPTLGATAISAAALTNGSWIRFNRGSGEVLDPSDILFFYIQSAATWPNKRTMQIQFRDTSNVAVGNAVTLKTGAYGFNSSDTTTAQLIAISVSAFGLGSTSIQYLQMTNAGGAIGFGMQPIGIQSVGDVVTPPGAGGITQADADVRYAFRGLTTASGLTMATDRLLGRDTASTGAVEEIIIGSGLSLAAGTLTSTGTGGTVTVTGTPANGELTQFSGASSITNGNLSGDVTTSGALVTTIAANAVTTAKILNANVTLAKIANAAANSKLVGSGAAGSGAAYAELGLGISLAMVGTTLNALPRVSSAASVASPLAWNSDNFDQYAYTALANALTINADAGTPTNGQKVIFRLKDDGTARALTWTTGASKAFRAVGVTLPTTTVISKTVYVGCIYNAADDRFDAIAVAQEA